MRFLIVFSVTLFAVPLISTGHPGSVDDLGCHASDKGYHCNHCSYESLTGAITHVRDGDTIELGNVAIRLSALDCPELDEVGGQEAKSFLARFTGQEAHCELTGSRSYDRLVGYCSISGVDIGEMMMDVTCQKWEKFDVWDRY